MSRKNRPVRSTERPPGLVHAPVQSLVDTVVSAVCQQGTPQDGGGTEYPTGTNEGQEHEDDQHGTVPPGHRNGGSIFGVVQMVGMIGFKDTVMGQRVRAESVDKIAQRADA